jgi:hypothetical protein
MKIWERTVLSMQKGIRKVYAGAAVFSERVEAEIAIVRLKIRMDDVRTRIDELHRDIGRTVVDLARKQALPPGTGQLLEQEEIASALVELEEREKEMEELVVEAKNERDAFREAEQHAEDAFS